MVLIQAIRTGWQLVLAATPRPLLARLDAWARRHAEQRVARRRRQAS